MKIKLHVAVIEWSDDSRDPVLFAAAEMLELKTQIRANIEAGIFEDDDPVSDYVLGPGLDEPDWDVWHSTMHEMDGTPWVTFDEIEVEIDA